MCTTRLGKPCAECRRQPNREQAAKRRRALELDAAEPAASDPTAADAAQAGEHRTERRAPSTDTAQPRQLHLMRIEATPSEHAERKAEVV